MKKAIILSLIWLLYCSAVVAPSIENVRFQQDGDQVIVTYDIVGSESWQTFDIELYLSKNNGYTYEKLRYVEGDVGFDVQAGYNKRIIWNALREVTQVVGDRIKFKVEATVKGKAPTPDNMVYVEGGTFKMVNIDNKPVHTTTVGSFYISKYEITVAEFRKFINATGYETDAEKKGESSIYDSSHKMANVTWENNTKGNTAQINHPVIHISWNDAKAYCDWRTKVTGKIHRLPTTAEWEYAAREGGKKVRFANGSNIANSNEMNFNAGIDYKTDYSVVGKYRGTTVPVSSFSPNALGLYNMSGNVSEWCSNSTSIRGGSWRDNPYRCRVAYKERYASDYSSYYVGFRCVRID